MQDQVYNDIPVEYRDRFQELLKQAPAEPDELRSEVQTYLGTVRQVAQMVKLLNLGEAEKLGQVALQLLDIADSPEEQRLVQAAVRYLVLEEDDEEITGVLGFDDDIHVMNAVSRALGREDLLVSTSRS